MKILIIFAHPDDETMFIGGTLALLNKAGSEIHFLCATRGEGGELGEPPVSFREEIHLYRVIELKNAIKALGGGTLSFLDYLDPLIGENEQLYPYTENFDELVKKILRVIQDIQPYVIITHGSNGEYGHPGHILTHRATQAAVDRLENDTPILYTFCANFPGHPRPRLANSDDSAHLILNINSAMEQKTQAAYCHRSQHALFLRRRSKQVGYRLTIPEILLEVESFHRASPPFVHEPEDDFYQVLSKYQLKTYERTLQAGRESL